MNDPADVSSLSQASEDRASETLKARALEISRPELSRQAVGEVLDVIEFRLAQERYAVERKYVREVRPFNALTPLPCTPSFLLGIVMTHGQLLPVLDIKKFFDLPDSGITDLHSVVVIRAADVELGILADSVLGARAIPTDAIQASLPTLTGIRAHYLKGVTGDHLIILDVPNILTDSRIIVNEEVREQAP